MSCLQVYEIVSKELFQVPGNVQNLWTVSGFDCDEGYSWYNLYEFSPLEGIQLDNPYLVESTQEVPLFSVNFLGSKRSATTREILLVAMNAIGFERY